MKTTAKLESTPIIHADSIARQKYIGPVEFEKDGEYEVYEIAALRITDGSRYLVAGSACNTGLICEFARAYNPDCESMDEALCDFVTDLEAIPHPSGALLAWHGSLVI